jgi:hypothetical protein
LLCFFSSEAIILFELPVFALDFLEIGDCDLGLPFLGGDKDLRLFSDSSLYFFGTIGDFDLEFLFDIGDFFQTGVLELDRFLSVLLDLFLLMGEPDLKAHFVITGELDPDFFTITGDLDRDFLFETGDFFL